jgi:hypothetical protein
VPFIVLHAAVDLPFLLIGTTGRPSVSPAVIPGLVLVVGASLAYALVLTRRREPPADSLPVAATPVVVAQRTNGNATASLILGICGVFLPVVASVPAVILGFKGKGQIDRSGGAEAGRGEAIAGIVLGFVVIGFAGLFVVAGFVGDAVMNSSFAPSGGRPAVAIEALNVGECYDAAPNDDVYRADCHAKHEGQVIWRGTMPPERGAYPGDEAVDKWAHDRCVAEITTFMVPRKNYGYDPYWWTPDGDMWKHGGRLVTCTAEAY